MGEAGVKSRVAFVLVDGLGDVGIPSLRFKSPVEAAKTPNLDALASGGVSGLMDPVEPGLGCGSDTAHLSLLGYNPASTTAGAAPSSPWAPAWPWSPATSPSRYDSLRI